MSAAIEQAVLSGTDDAQVGSVNHMGMALYVREGENFVVASEEQVMQGAEGLLRRRYLRPGMAVLDCPSRIQALLLTHLGTLDYEVFGSIFLDAGLRLLAIEELRGTIDRVTVHPIEIVKAALRYRAEAIILYHNRTSGLVAPSEDDRRKTHRLREALALIDVRVIDHLIVGETIYSFYASGLL